MKPSFNEVFWIINSEMFKPQIVEPWIKEEVAKELDYIRYEKVIPVYVKSVNDMYDGTTNFDITPVDTRGGKSLHWKWSRSVEDKELGVTVFLTLEEAEASFKEKYSAEQIAEFAKKHELRTMYSGSM